MRALFVLLLAGCAAAPTYRVTPIDYSASPPADWPKLDERITYADLQTTRRFCNKPKTTLDGCAVVSFRFGLCMIYLSNREPALLEHERAHCDGYSHVGEGGRAATAWAGWKAGQKLEMLTQ